MLVNLLQVKKKKKKAQKPKKENLEHNSDVDH